MPCARVNDAPAYIGGATALQLAAIGGYLGVAEFLLQAGADLNASGATVHGRTALEVAAEHGRLDMVKFLINGGAFERRRQAPALLKKPCNWLGVTDTTQS